MTLKTGWKPVLLIYDSGTGWKPVLLIYDSGTGWKPVLLIYDSEDRLETCPTNYQSLKNKLS